jgi:hypothetical protein
MDVDERWQFLADLDEALLKGGAVLSEKSAILIRHADLAFVGSAHLACLLTAMAAIEAHLRGEWSGNKLRLVDLIDASELEDSLKQELHAIRRYRNGWVHVDDPWDDEHLLENPEKAEEELFDMAKRVVVVLRKTIYDNPWI